MKYEITLNFDGDAINFIAYISKCSEGHITIDQLILKSCIEYKTNVSTLLNDELMISAMEQIESQMKKELTQ